MSRPGWPDEAHRPVGIDDSEQQLGHRPPAPGRARTRVPATSTATPRPCRYPDASFDLAISEYGASIWADPYPLDPRGQPPAAPRVAALIFLVNSDDPFGSCASARDEDGVAATNEMVRPSFGLPDRGSMESSDVSKG